MLTELKRAVSEPSNTKATTASVASALTAVLTVLSGLSYDLGPLALVIPPNWKPTILWASGAATAALWLYGEYQKALIRKDTAKKLKHR